MQDIIVQLALDIAQVTWIVTGFAVAIGSLRATWREW